MNIYELQSALKELDREGIYVFSTNELQVFFPNEPHKTFRNALERFAKKGVVTRVARGVYVNTEAKSWDQYPLEQIAKILRRGEYNYVSLETRLSEASVISQMTLNTLTVMTTGRKNTYKTDWGTIEFTHTKRPLNEILEGTHVVKGRPLRVASPNMAYTDLKNVNRNVGMVDLEELKDVG